VDARARAAVTLADLEQAFWAPGPGPAYLEWVPRRGRQRCYLWPLSHVVAAILDGTELGMVDPGRARELVEAALEPYHRSGVEHPAYDSAARPPVGPGGDRFYDDNAWVALDLLRCHELTGSTSALERAQEVFSFLVSGWDSDAERPRPGGVRWVESPTNADRNAVSTLPSAQIGYRLHRLTGDAEALVWADRMLGWASEVLRDPDDGLYWDRVSGDGRIDTTKWSYNQGNVIGAELAGFRARARVDPDRAARHLARAESTALAVLAHYPVLPGGWAGQGLPFNAITFRNLLELRRAIPTSPVAAEILATAHSYTDEVWRTRRGPDRLFRSADGGVPAVIDQAAAVELFALVALATPRGRQGTSPFDDAGPGDEPPAAGGGSLG
jgi:hypothetical protein